MEGLADQGTRPRMEGLIVDGPNGGLAVTGCAFTGGVDLFPGAGISAMSFDSCDLDSGVTQHIEDSHDYEYIAIRRSRIRGLVKVYASNTICEADTFEAGSLQCLGEANGSVSNCLFQGPGAYAVQFSASDANSHSAIGNTIDGYSIGVYGGPPQVSALIENNLIRNCHNGINVELLATIRGNDVRDCEVGILASCEDSYSSTITGNTVLGSGQAGIQVWIGDGTSAQVLENVVGRSEQNGIHVQFPIDSPLAQSNAVIRGNTSYRNGEAGFRVITEGTHFTMSLDRNIAFENGTYGVDADTSTTPDGCNDWFGNVLGSTRGVTLSGTDLAVDPMFCDVDADSVHLSQKSPLLNAPGCGLIGARGLGCATTATLLSLFTAERDAEGVRLRWQVSSTSSFELWIERAPAAAGPWSRIATERTTEGGVTTDLDRDAVAADDSWYRLVVREGGEVATLGEPLRVSAAAAGKFELVRIAPNPGPGPTRFRFTLAHEASVELDVFDLQGRHLASLVRGTLTAGVHVVKWSAPDLNAPGVRLVRYRYPGGQQVRRFVLAR